MGFIGFLWIKSILCIGLDQFSAFYVTMNESVPEKWLF